MYSMGATINLGGFQSVRVDVAFPMNQLPTGWTFRDVRAWTQAWFRYEIKNIIRGEISGGNQDVDYRVFALENETEVDPPTHPDLPMPPLVPADLPEPPPAKPYPPGGLDWS